MVTAALPNKTGLSALRENAGRYLLLPSFLGGVAGAGLDYVDQRGDYERDDFIKSLGRIGHGGFAGLGMGAAALTASNKPIKTKIPRALLGGIGGYFLYDPIYKSLQNLFNKAAVNEVDRRQDALVRSYVNK